MQVFLQQFINGLSLGSIYALVAVGYTMVYGVLQLINFAHGDVFMVGAALTLLMTRWFGYAGEQGTRVSAGGFLLCALLSIIACGVIGFLIEFLAYRPLRNRPRINALITAIGVSLLLEYGFQLQSIFGPTPRAFPVGMIPWIGKNVIDRHGLVVSRVDALVLIITIGLMLILSYIVLRTRTGLALRAVSFRFDTASLMGINVNRIISFTFILGSCLAAAAGILFSIKYPKVEPLMGLLPGVKAFTAAVFGGIGNITGAVVGGLALGLIEVLVIGYLPGGSQYKDAIAFVILIVILLVKPSGLFGRSVTEKV